MSRYITTKEHTGIMIALYPDEESARRMHEISLEAFGDDESSSPEELHLTLKYFGKTSNTTADFHALANVVLSLALSRATAACVVSGVGRFFNTDEQAVYLSIDSEDARNIYQDLCSMLSIQGLEYDSEHGFNPHITIGYASYTPDIYFDQFPITLDKIALCWGDKHIMVPLLGDKQKESIPETVEYISDKDFTSNMINKLWESGVIKSDVEGIWYSPSDRTWFVDIGDWAEKGTSEKILSVLGKDTEVADEYHPPKGSKFTMRLKGITTKPWSSSDVDKHIHGLSDRQKKRWVAVANSALKRCQDSGGSNCEGRAIQMANGIAKKAVWTTEYINNLPDSAFLYIESGGKKVGGKTEPRSKRHFPYKDASGKIDLPHLRNAIARIPQSNALGLNKVALQARARRLLGSSGDKPMAKKEDNIKSSLAVFKQSNGKYRWVLYSSNPYEDSDREFVTMIAQESDINSLEESNDYGPLRWWHVGDPYFEEENNWRTVKAGPGIDLGICDFAAMHGLIRVESGTFFSEDVGMAIANHAGALEGSLGFSHPRKEPDKGGGFLHIKTFERSLTPPGMASNPFTSLMVGTKENIMDAAKLKALKDLGVDIDQVVANAEDIQKKASGKAPYRMKANTSSNGSRSPSDDDEDLDSGSGDIASKLDQLTAQMKALQTAMKEDDTSLEPEEKLEDMMVAELTVGELQDIVTTAIVTKSASPTGLAFKAVLEELQEIKEILTSKSVQSVVDEVARMKAKLERQGARLKATASKVREMDDEQPRLMKRGTRPSESDDTLLDLEDDADISSKGGDSNNPFSWLDDFVQKP